MYTKHFPIKTFDNLHKSEKYIQDALKVSVSEDNRKSIHLDNLFQYMVADDKTLMKQLVSSHGIVCVQNAYEEFKLTKMRFEFLHQKNFTFSPELGRYQPPTLTDIEKNGKVLARHFIQSFSPEDDLTPEQIHQIGRETMLEFTGGEYEFVIATHVDKAHIHNHILVNTTNMNTGKSMKWKIPRQKNGKQKDVSFAEFEKVSDKVASKYGAMIIEKSPRNSHQKYTMWQTESIYKTKIKSRLDFLIAHSSSIEDFKVKADALHLEVDFSKKWATYKLLDEPQIKVTRGRSLVKSDPEKYNKDRLVDVINQNTGIFSVEDVVNQYEETVTKKESDFDYQVLVEPWQLSHKTDRGYYLNVDFGFDNQKQVFVGSYKVDQLDDGNYFLYIKQNDYFYLMDNKSSADNHYITGRTLIKQMMLYNGHTPLKKEPVMSTINELVDAINFLAENNVTEGRQLSLLEQKLEEAFHEATETVQELSDKIMELQQLSKLLLDVELSDDKEAGLNRLKELMPLADVDDLTFSDVEAEVQSVSKSRDFLKERLDTLVKEINQVHTIQSVASKKEEPEKGISL